MYQKPALYGVKNSNRDFTSPYAWGKNQFNSSFPAALACYMRDANIPAIYIKHGKSSATYLTDLAFEDFWQTTLPNDRLFFAFEYRYSPYSAFTLDDIPPIDLVVSESDREKWLRPVEIKLTTLPDNTTAEDDEADYGSELVIRSPTMRYAALGMAHSITKHMAEIKELFTPSCGKIRDWDNLAEVVGKRGKILSALETFLARFSEYQQPLLMQTIWKTEGKSATLAHNCLDIFVWSDFALSRLLMDFAPSTDEQITRPQRSALRLARFLYEFSHGGKVYQQPIYDGMTYGTLNDKEFAVSGKETNPYMRCPRLLKPIITKAEIKNLILGGGQKHLNCIRDFDSILFVTKELFDVD